MSIQIDKSNPSSVLTFIKSEVDAWADKVGVEKEISLHLSEQQFPLAISSIAEKNSSTFCFLTLAPAKLRATLKATRSWQQELSHTSQWHLIEPLSQQELEGVIITPEAIAMHHLLLHTPNHNFIISSDAAQHPVPSRQKYREHSLEITLGEQRDLHTLISLLTNQGYIRGHKTVESGTFTVTGEMIEVAHPTHTGTYQIILYGTTVEKIVHREDRRTKDVTSFVIPPIKFPTETTSWQEIVSSSTVITSQTFPVTGSKTIYYDALETSLHFPFREQNSLQNIQKDTPVVCLYENLDHVQELTRIQELPQVTFYSSSLSQHPLLLKHDSLTIVSEYTLAPKTKKSSPITQERAMELISELKPGKPAVHADHGIGIFEGIETRSFGDGQREYLTLRYAEGDVLSVPVEYAHKVTPYIGEKIPAIHRLHGSSWIKIKKKAKHDAIAFAKELLAIARQRNASERSPYVIESQTEQELSASFPHELTPDQKRTWDELREDLQSSIPIDRVIVGDVGFGKTEIALRAAYHAVANGKQVAVLAPTTLLVQQHFDTFQRRLPKLKNQIGMLSRFTSSTTQKKTRTELENGNYKICIGTHALLSNRTVWKNLGLVIIDEEQRFGVKQKEHFKKIRSTSDVVSLSATPIPRTLSMALSGLRQLSLITTAPKERKDVITQVARVNEELLVKAIGNELNRKGQVYIVAPKIRNLAAIREQVAALFPKAKIDIAHGQMPDERLGSLIHQFDEGKIDILVSSSIVENGLDLPNANTMIVWHAPHFGLSDLYQLRGRIGRREKQGYCYFLFDQQELTPIQKQRLTAITEASRLGSGWLIAQRDLEIRGAGNLLGAEQSGTVGAIGVQLYLDLVQQAVREEEIGDVTVELPFPSLIPQHYISDSTNRTRWYIRLTRASEDTLPEHIKNLEETFGSLPLETQNLIRSIKVQKIGGRVGISKVSSHIISPPDENPYERLEITSSQLPRIIAGISELGNWRIKNNIATLDMDKITPEIIDKLIAILQKQ